MNGARAFKRAVSQSIADATLQEIADGLAQHPKQLPCKLFYDAQGSELFEQICELDEYYLTRTELDILTSNLQEIADEIGPGRALVEYGSGASLKTRLLLDALPSVAAYVPIDICEPALVASENALRRAYPQLPIFPVCADYTGAIELPNVVRESLVAGFFPGSTIGNFQPSSAADFLTRVRGHCGADGKLLIGVDLRKDESTLLAAYNDRKGVTARFNSNLLRVLNRDHDAYFRPDEFEHRAIWNGAEGRVEMHLVSKSRQVVQVDSMAVRFDAGEPIVTEYCYKYSVDQFRELSERSGFRVERVWLDPRQLFSVQLLVTD
jgi:dimethylhistidine N-methyltransferase